MPVKFNADPNEVRSTPGMKLVFVHVGKCAGESILRVLQKYAGNRLNIFEMHCYDANSRIRNLAENFPSETFMLIAKRDPVRRFVSAFNWDKHNLILSGKMAGTRFEELYAEFPTPARLIDALGSAATDVRQRANDLSRFGHMAMGQAWYTPPCVVDMLPAERTIICDVNSLKEDLSDAMLQMGVAPTEQDWCIPTLKSDFADAYPSGQEIFQTHLDPEAVKCLRLHIAADVEVYESLTKHH